MEVMANHLNIGLLDKNGVERHTRVLNYHLARDPEIAFLWTSADNYANLLNPELSISCPFVITLTLMVEDQVKSQNEANLKFLDLEKKSKTSYAKYFPSVEKEVKEWGIFASDCLPIPLHWCPIFSTLRRIPKTIRKRHWPLNRKY
jgi:conjugal transfer ATP-binding protein TraC